MSGANVIKDVGDLSGHTWLRPPRAALRCSRWQGREGRVTDTRIDAWPKAKGAEARRPAEGAAWRAIDGRRGLAHARGCPRGRATDGTKPCASCKQVATTRMASREWEAAISSQKMSRRGRMLRKKEFWMQRILEYRIEMLLVQAQCRKTRLAPTAYADRDRCERIRVVPPSNR